MSEHAGDPPEIESLPNLRDVGGYLTKSGRRVRMGLLYRSGVLDRLTDADAVKYAGLGLRTIYDLRNDFERAAHPDPVPPGAEYIVVDMTEDGDDKIPRNFEAAMRDARVAEEVFGPDGGVATFRLHYKEFVNKESARRALGRMFGQLADPARRPALVHCMGGKDRTGWSVAALHMLLGVPPDQVMADYLLTNERIDPMWEFLAEDYKQRGGYSAHLNAVLKAHPEYLESALEEVRAHYGDIEAYFSVGLGLRADQIESLREQFLDGN